MVHPPRDGPEPLTDGSVRAAEQATEVARGFLLVAAPDGGNAVDTVLMVVSELFTNAVRHAGGVTRFELKAGAGTVTVAAVHDAGPLPPQPRPMDATRPAGFVWQLVQDLSIDVWVQVHASGKTVTAVVPCLHGSPSAGLTPRIDADVGRVRWNTARVGRDTAAPDPSRRPDAGPRSGRVGPGHAEALGGGGRLHRPVRSLERRHQDPYRLQCDVRIQPPHPPPSSRTTRARPGTRELFTAHDRQR
ncbi:ATP-binding protein [Streptomyces canus]|uniref:ATP-binding protein n=1 Tax=Streptomyces canus TaxID=58343 RepID=UPI0038653647